MSYIPAAPIQASTPQRLLQRGSMPNLTIAKQRIPSATVSPPRIVLHGHSVTAGEGAGTGTYGLIGSRANSCTVQLAKALGWQTGSFFGTANVQGVAGVTVPTYDPRITMPGNWVADTNTTFGTVFISCSGASTADFTFTPESQFDTYTIYYPITTTQSNNFNIKLDGVVVQNINANNATNGMGKTTLTCTLGTHTISIQNIDSTAGRFCFLVGMETRNSTSTAPILLQGSKCGGLLADLTVTTNPWSWANVVSYLKPDVVITMCLINDLNGSGTVTTLQPTIDLIVNSTQKINADPVFLLDNPFGTGAAGVPVPGPGTAAVFNGTLSTLGAIMQNNISAYNGSYADLRAIFGATLQQACNKGMMFDNAHPNAAAHLAIANFVAKLFS